MQRHNTACKLFGFLLREFQLNVLERDRCQVKNQRAEGIYLFVEALTRFGFFIWVRASGIFFELPYEDFPLSGYVDWYRVVEFSVELALLVTLLNRCDEVPI